MISVSGNPFKSIIHYNLSNDSTGITITGNGMVFIRISNVGYIEIDNNNFIRVDTGYSNSYPTIFLFKDKCRIYTGSNANYYIQATVGLFN